MTDQPRLTVSLTQTDPEELAASALRPQSSSSRRSVSHRQSQPRLRLYRHENSSSTSIDSTAFFDHRDQPQSLSRHLSISRPTSSSQSRGRKPHFRSRPDGHYSSDEASDHDEEQEQRDDERFHLARQTFAPWTKPRQPSIDEGTRLLGSSDRLEAYGSSSHPETRGGNGSPSRGAGRPSPTETKYTQRHSHVNHPSSIPSSIGSPPLRARTFSVAGPGADGEMISVPLAQRVQRRLTQTIPAQADVLIDIEPPPQSSADLSALPPISSSPGCLSSKSSSAGSGHSRRKPNKAEEDVCFPTEEPSHKAPWPDYGVLEEWATQETKALEEGSVAVRVGEGKYAPREGHRKISEPVMVDGRYRRGYTFPSSTPYDV